MSEVPLRQSTRPRKPRKFPDIGVDMCELRTTITEFMARLNSLRSGYLSS